LPTRVSSSGFPQVAITRQIRFLPTIESNDKTPG
jgi:hypothetical protein